MRAKLTNPYSRDDRYGFVVARLARKGRFQRLTIILHYRRVHGPTHLRSRGGAAQGDDGKRSRRAKSLSPSADTSDVLSLSFAILDLNNRHFCARLTLRWLTLSLRFPTLSEIDRSDANWQEYYISCIISWCLKDLLINISYNFS